MSYTFQHALNIQDNNNTFVKNGNDKKTLQQSDLHLADATVHTTTGDLQRPTPEGEEENEEAPIDMTFPKHSLLKRIVYIISFPLMAPLYLTLPDMRNKEFTIFPSFKVPGTKVEHAR